MSEMETGHVTATDGARIFYRATVPEKPRGAVFLLHGYAEHSGRYSDVMNHLSNAGYAVFAPDHRGHGQTAELLGYVSDFNAIVSDVLLIRSLAKERCGEIPTFILGHSMGGLVALLHTQRYPEGLKGIITSGAALAIPPDIPALVIKLSHFLGRVVPKLGVQSFFDPNNLTRTEAIREAVKIDPYFYRGRIRARTGSCILRAINMALTNLASIELPALLMHGGADALVPPEISDTIHMAIASTDKTLKVFPEAYHEIFNEPESEEALTLVTRWLDEHC
jgi:acylglycerol lipase